MTPRPAPGTRVTIRSRDSFNGMTGTVAGDEDRSPYKDPRILVAIDGLPGPGSLHFEAHELESA